MTLTILFGFLFAILTASIALLHFYWALGGRNGLNAAIPSRDDQPLFRPSPLTTALVGLMLLLAALITLEYVGILSLVLPGWFVAVAMWMVGLVFLLRSVGDFKYVGFFKSYRGTRFARLDSQYYSPLCLGLALLVLGVMLTSHSPLN